MGMALGAETFSHKRHAPLKLKCVVCHAGAEKADKAAFPKAAQCTVCHNGAEWKAPEIPSQRVYQQRDFVVFSHARHVTAGKVACATCHGEVAQADVVSLAVEHTMKNCMACHKERAASNACNVCHELGQ